ncbi:MAG: DNA-3-methyladenine glycosylase I, partial [Tepidiformaceae bacterium]
GLADYLEVMTKAVFQSGMSWRVVEAKWPGFQRAFDGFEPERVATLTPPDIDAIAQDPGVIRNRRKIEATVHNAQTLIELEAQKGGVRGYLRSFTGYDELERDLGKRFKFLGPMGVYYWLWVVGEQVPGYEDWRARTRRRTSRR